jgi:hypothetical protein
MNDFENTLKQQPIRSVPAGWRRDILNAAEEAARPRWQEWLWPAPAAWVAVAACWLIVFGLQLAARPSDGPSAGLNAVAVSERLAALDEQRRLVAELTGSESAEPRADSPVKPVPMSEMIRKTMEVQHA